MFRSRTTGPSNAGCAQANIFVPSGELGVRSAAMKRFIMISQRASVPKCVGWYGRAAAPLHFGFVRGDQLTFRSSTPIFGSTTKLQHFRQKARERGNERR